MSVFKLLSIIVLAALVTGCAGMGEVYVPPNLDSYEGLSESLQRGDKISVYDVRTADEYVTGHIPGAVNIPHGEIAKALPRRMKRAVIVVYCASGGRSYMAFEALTEEGYKYLTDFGGIGNWQGELVTGTSPDQ
ncbi:MAG: rhodanese-like domain-containing protein [Spirochaetales bacterium]|jgi:phage shock protein E|nr:rhodanese-like domain-containing protein [Spirochaetales bacterium]